MDNSNNPTYFWGGSVKKMGYEEAKEKMGICLYKMGYAENLVKKCGESLKNWGVSNLSSSSQSWVIRTVSPRTNA